jgi:hypothetical protein
VTIEFRGGRCNSGSVHGGSWAVALFSVLCNGAGQGVAQGANAAHREGQGAHRAGAVASCGAQTWARRKQNLGRRLFCRWHARQEEGRTGAALEGRRSRGTATACRGGARRPGGRQHFWWRTSRRSCGGCRRSRSRRAAHRKQGHRQLGHGNGSGCAGMRGKEREAERCETRVTRAGFIGTRRP